MESSKGSKFSNMTEEAEFKVALVDFDKIKRDKSIPQKMLAKLLYLEHKLLGKPIDPQLSLELPSYERASLEECNYSVQMKLFCSIVKCLSGKEILEYFKDERAYFRKDEVLSRWKKCYISCDSNQIKLCKKRDFKSLLISPQIKHIRISVKYRFYKDKQCFGLIYDNKKYFIGFDLESTCIRVHKIIRQLFKESESKSSHAKNSFSHQEKLPREQSLSRAKETHRTFDLNLGKQEDDQEITEFVEVKRNRTQTESDIRGKQAEEFERVNDFGEEQVDLEKRHEEELSLFEREIKRETFSSDKNYRLISNFELGRILIDQEGVKLKLSALMSVEVKFEWIFEQFLDMKSWNLEIDECRVLNKISSNSYKVLLRFRKYGLMYLPRWACVTVTAVKIEDKMYLLIRDDNSESEDTLAKQFGSVNSVKMSFYQIIELCKRNQKDSRILMTIITKADFGGMCSKADNINMANKILQNIQNFYNFLLSQNAEETGLNLFSFDDQIERGRKSSINSNNRAPQINPKSSCTFSEQSQRSEVTSNMSGVKEEDEDYFIPNEKNEFTTELKKTMTHMVKESEDFLKLLRNYQNLHQGSEEYVRMIRDRVFQSYYIGHRFSQNESHLEVRRYPNTKDDNFITQRGRWKISQEELIFTDKQSLDRSKNVVKLVLKQISSNVMAGKSIMNMSLPVEIFDDKSFLEKIAEGFGFLPDAFKKAASETNLVKQISSIAQGLFFSTPILPNIQKPFNPILGETYTCSIGGVDVYLEQISHHPPVSAFLISNDEFTLSGSYNPQIDMGLNSVVAKNLTSFRAKFHKTETSYIIIAPDYEMGGLMFGDRKVKMTGKGVIFEEKNQLLLELSFGKVKKGVYESSRKLRSGEIIGGIYKVSPDFKTRIKAWNSAKSFQGVKSDEKIEEFAKITGNWLGEMFVDGVLVKDVFDPAPYAPISKLYALPSDCSFRLDSYFKRVGDLKRSQEEKEYLEDLQRKERKLREEYTKKNG